MTKAERKESKRESKRERYERTDAEATNPYWVYYSHVWMDAWETRIRKQIVRRKCREAKISGGTSSKWTLLVGGIVREWATQHLSVCLFLIPPFRTVRPKTLPHNGY
jgi:hypothetical protein